MKVLKTWNHKAILGLKYKGEKPLRLKDPAGNSLVLKVTKKSKTWVCQVRQNGTVKTLTIGSFPNVGLSEARAKAAVIQTDRDEGVDVYVEHGAGDAVVAEPAERSGMTCQDAFDAYIGKLETGTNLHGKRSNKASTLAEKKRIWTKYFANLLGGVHIADVTEDALLDVIEPYREESEAGADTITAYMKAFFKWAKANKRLTGLMVNPAEDLPKGKVAARTRVLSKDEIRWIWRALESESPIWRDAYRLDLLTALRRQEVFGLERGEFNLVDQTLDIAAVRMKNGVDFRVGLGTLAAAIVERRLKATTSKFLFPTTDGKKAVTGFSKAAARIRDKVDVLAKKEGRTVQRWTMHDFRRTFSSIMNAMTNIEGNRLVAKDHIERSLSHVMKGVEGVYDRNDYLAEKRRVLGLWEAEISRIVDLEQSINIENHNSNAA
ncbi:site-specific integrase [Sphingobium sp. H39-3-25]|uniref:tyrosine-type recombinase/integrase n=1 Tax=Sphingobium arseniciresistens TaxID=3030834 RepID=UPI0023B943B7|nr:site-specific integrase [Sphingobium arseniciresistens]